MPHTPNTAEPVKKRFPSAVPGTVRGLLVAGFGLLTVILLVAVFAAAWMAREHERSLEHAETHSDASAMLKDIRVDATTQIATVFAYLMTGQEPLLDQVQSYRDRQDQALIDVEALLIEDGHADAEAAEIERIAGDAREIYDELDRAAALRAQGDTGAAVSILAFNLPGLTELGARYDVLANGQRETVAGLRGDAQRTANLVLYLLIASGALGGTIALGAGFWIGRSILRPLRALEDAAHAIAAGDLDARAPATGPREFVRLGESLNQMTEYLLDASKRRELEEERERAFAELAEAHAQLAETTLKLDAVLTNVPEVVYSADFSNGTITFISDAIRRYGYEPQPFLDGTLDTIAHIHPDDRDRVAAAFATETRERDAFTLEYRFRDSDGRYHTVRNSVQPKRDATTGAVLVDGVITDITEVIEAEEALRESEERFRKIFEESPLGMAVVTLDFHFERANAAYCEMTGYREEELQDLTFVDITHPADADFGAEQARRLLAGEIPSTRFEKRYVRKDGSTVWVNLTASLVRHPDGGPLHLLAQAENITARKWAEALAHTQHTVTSILAESPSLKAAAPALMQAMCEGLGWEFGELWQVDEAAGVLRCAATWCAPGSGLTGIEEASRSFAFAPGEGLPGRVWDSQAPIWVPDVTVDPEFPRAPVAEKHGLHAAIAFPVRDTGKTTGVVGFFGREIREPDQDLMITMGYVGAQVGQFVSRKQAEEALRQSEARLRSIADTTQEWIWAVDMLGRFTYSSASVEPILGYRPDEIIGADSWSLLHPEDRPALELQQESWAKAKTGWDRVVARTRHRDGTYRYIESSGVPLLDAEGNITGYHGSDRDVTERVEAEQALRTAEERLRTVISNAPVILWTIDREGTVLMSRGKALEAFGLEPDQVVGNNVFEMYSHLPEVQDAHSRSLAGEEVKELLEERGRIFESRYTPVRDAAGQVTGVIAIAIDITERKRAEDALRESEEHFRSLTEDGADVILALDLQGKVTYASPSVSRVLGYAPDEVAGARAIDFVHPDDLPAVAQALDRSYTDDNRNTPIEFRARHKDGSWLVLESMSRGMDDPSGNVTGAVINCRDVTERKLAEEKLQRSEEHFRSLIENASDVISIIDPEGTIVYESPSVRRVLGYEPDEMIGTKALEFMHPDDVPATLQALADGWADQNVTPKLEVRYRHKDGSWRHIEATGHAITDESGALHAVINSRDVTDRRRAEEALRASEEYFRALIEDGSDLITILRPDGTVVYESPSITRMLGYSPEELVGRRVLDFIHPDDAQLVVEAVAAGFRDPGQAPTVQLRFRHKDGSWRYIESIGRASTDPTGAPIGIITSRDTTERRESEEALRKLNDELEREQREIEALNRSLEDKVRERTLELNRTADELRERNRQLQDARSLAVTDALTGLPNHRSFHERVRGEVAEADVSGSSIGLVMLDIDGFKNVNDSRGHMAGDQILRELADTLCAVVKREDAFRYGGDEFAVLLPGADHGETARTAERLRQAVAKNISHNGSKLTISLGAAAFPQSADTVEELIYGADSAMYSAKFAGKNRVGKWDRERTQRLDGRPRTQLEREDAAADSISALIAALTAKDPQTCAHGTRCSWYAQRTAEELGLPPEERSVVKIAALLHDIGKLAIREDVLFKPGPLDEEEWIEMRRHPRVGRDILAHLRVVSRATPAVLHHHERYDGKGYPDGLKGEDIPIASRILLVTDAFDAMVTDRAYRKALPIQTAIAELNEHSGTQFDPVVIEAFLRIIERGDASPLHQVTHKKEKARSRKTHATVEKAANGTPDSHGHPHSHGHEHPEEVAARR